MTAEYQDRGQTRSGKRFAQANVGHYTSLERLLAHHSRLLEEEEASSTRLFRLGRDRGYLFQATLRYSVNHPDLRGSLVRHFSRMFAGHVEGRCTGYEVAVTFNAVLSNPEGTSFSLFYGHDFRAGNLAGAAPELSYRPQGYLIRTVGDVQKLPVEFDFDALAETHRHQFEESGVRIARFLNIVYLVYRYVPVTREFAARARTSRRSRDGAAREAARRLGRRRDLPEQGLSGLHGRIAGRRI